MTIVDDIRPLSREQLRVLANPLRMRILNRLCRREMSTAELGRELPDAPSNLYHHVHKLLDAGLLELVRTEPRRGAVERYYRAVAPGFTVPPELLAGGAAGTQPELLTTVRGMLEDALAALADSFRRGLTGPSPAAVPMINACEVRASPERIAELRRRTEELVEEILGEPDAGEEGTRYAFLQMFFPVAGGASGEEDR